MWNRVAQFIGTQNIARQTPPSRDFRNILDFAFQEGYHQSSRLEPEPADAGFKVFCPVQKTTVLRKGRVPVAGQDRDAGQVGHVKLFVMNVVASNVPLCFTETIMKIHPLNCSVIHDVLVQTIPGLVQKSIQVSGVLCHGARYQVKLWTPPIQNPSNSRLVRCYRIAFCLSHVYVVA
jgi:hypothetical protein